MLTKGLHTAPQELASDSLAQAVDTLSTPVSLQFPDSVQAALIAFLHAATAAQSGPGTSWLAGLGSVLISIFGLLGPLFAMLAAYFGLRTTLRKQVGPTTGDQGQAREKILFFGFALLSVFSFLVASFFLAALLVPISILIVGLAAWAYVFVVLDGRYQFLSPVFGARGSAEPPSSSELEMAAEELNELVDDLIKARKSEVVLGAPTGDGKLTLELRIPSDVESEPGFAIIDGAIVPVSVFLDLKRENEVHQVDSLSPRMALVRLVDSDGPSRTQPSHLPISAVRAAVRGARPLTSPNA